MTTRYSSKTTAALEEILSGQSGEPETVASMIEKLATDAVVAGFPSLQTLRGPDVTWSTEDSADDLSFDLSRKTESHSAAVEL
ncbi:hypothetical protein DXT68_04205 [Microbacterium foliorum]|nr:hypothetical protein DXT68_04205 [Microbacterium foliorum]